MYIALGMLMDFGKTKKIILLLTAHCRNMFPLFQKKIIINSC